MYIDNSALTLRNYLVLLKKHSEQDRPIKVALYSVFNIEEPDGENDALLWDKISKLMSLPKKIEDALKDYFPDEEITCPNWRPTVNNFFGNLNLNEPLKHSIQRVNDIAINELGMISLLFKTKGQIGKLNHENIKEITLQLLDLKESILKGDFPIELQKDMLHYINNMIRAFDDYDISGIEPIISATEATMGHACMSQPFQDTMKNTSEGTKLKGIIKKTLSSINSIEGIASLGANAVTMIEFFNK
ncbi:hypothetical protein SMY33_000036 [Cronobacter malonaticus]|uniref:hypothetical protein n=1 Tax=Cronobacter malonaticus TaxID=413503 RepID=UPI000CFAD1B6|nr:hypothetical protein [Cronobacter malonaticus]EKY3234028.1 hypothetical protein [Cronobacter malonaticus]ELY4023624.1 hypothetical protein [Cronobacter malonaticus]MDI7685868.1 hypothetical protein [Cronobacter malonaticus]